ncbi:Cobalt-dependent inorganic pyrophosphatase [Roseimaritima multifibrata]|uniref:inorganic diphosphatase n=1 Tax=Roseimaritima multifibrata TaxID=1930274 RepID=A0A517MBN1_9BACT|nr:putative manganese-dependent inorganic diphosphatase [Roseimaritima multifibrata]QDS92304.1 Cobalt-dependent inorganic pyrophosphatase [Roseimaritima multifibrata]
MPLLVFGHRNPDTDAICAALAYANLLRQTTHPDAVAACCGPANRRTEFALKRCGLEPPRIIMDVRPEVEDVCHRDVVTAEESEVFYEVYRRLKKHELRSIPVLDKDQTLVGILSLLSVMELIFDGEHDARISRCVSSSLEKIRRAVDGWYQNEVEVDKRQDFMVMVGAMSAEKFTEKMGALPHRDTLVVSGDRPTIQLPALEREVRGLMVTGGFELSPGLLQIAKANGVTVIVSPYDTATTTMRIKSARAILPAVERNFVSLSAKQPIEEARQQIARSNQAVFPVLEDDGSLIGVLSKSDLVNPPKPQLVLVDHNELGQAVDGAEGAEILEVLDHHRLGGSLRSTQPMRFIMEPVGSTCTLVAQRYRMHGIDPTPGMALCMASGIISDTLFLRSPTTTDVDRNVIDWLAGFCDTDLESFAKEFFETGSALRVSNAERVVGEDCKEFEEHGHRFSISQIEEIGFDLFWSRKDELADALEQLTVSRNLDFSALMITDIATNGSLLLMSREPACWEEINYPRVDLKLYKLDNVVSRKKQLLPLFSSLLETGGDHSDAR